MSTMPIAPPSAPSPPPSPPSGSNYDQIGAALSSEPSQAEPESTEPVVDAPIEAAGTETQSTEPTAPAVEEPKTTEATETEAITKESQAAPERNPYEDVEDIAPQTLDTLMKTDRGREIYQSHKTLREFSKPLEDGGIGHIPSVEQIRDYYGAYRDQVIMDHDLNSANPQQADRLLSHLFNSQRGPGAQVVASQIAPALARLNGETYAAAAAPFIQNYSNALLERYEKAPNGPDGSAERAMKNALWYAANMANYDMTGEFIQSQANGNGANGANGNTNGHAPDPLASQRAELEQRAARVQQMEAEQSRAQLGRWNNELTSSIRSNLNSELDRALDPLKTLYGDKTKKYERDRKDFHDLVIADVPKHDRHAWELYQVRLAEARQYGSREQLDAVAREYVRLAQPVIHAKRKSYLEEAGVAIKNVSDARHAELRSIDAKKAATSNGAPVNTAPQTSVKRNPGESTADFNLRQLRA